MVKRMWWRGIIGILMGIGAWGAATVFLQRAELPPETPSAFPTFFASPSLSPSLPPSPAPTARISSPAARPATVLLDVPFVSQAPTRSWVQPYQDACEEAALLAAYLWQQGRTPSRAEIHAELLELVETGQQEHGHGGSISARKMVELFHDAYGEEGIRLVPSATVEDVKDALAKGQVVLLPMAGRRLQGPFYQPPGPLYHALLVRGYDEEEGVFIVNDPGTNTKGEAFRFSEAAIARSWNDWDDERHTLAPSSTAHPMIVVAPSAARE